MGTFTATSTNRRLPYGGLLCSSQSAKAICAAKAKMRRVTINLHTKWSIRGKKFPHPLKRYGQVNAKFTLAILAPEFFVAYGSGLELL